MIEVVYELQRNKLLIEEQATRSSYDALHSIAKSHGLDYQGALFIQVLNDLSLETAFFSRNSPVAQTQAMDIILRELKSKKYDLTDTSLPLEDRLIRGTLIEKSYSEGGLVVREHRHRPLLMVSKTGQLSEVLRLSYEGRRIASVSHTGIVAVMGLYADFDPVDIETIDNLAKATFGTDQVKQTPDDITNFERLLGDMKIDLP